MDFEAARKVIHNQAASLEELGRAAITLFADNATEGLSIVDLIACLEQGNRFGGVTLIDELAALILYKRTGRPRKASHRPYEDFITNAPDWRSYLQEMGLM